MPCILAALGLLMPRTVMIFIALLTNWFGLAYETAIWPVLGWFFMPYTTLAYMAAMLNNDYQVTGGWLVLLIAAVIVDLSANAASTVSKPNNG